MTVKPTRALRRDCLLPILEMLLQPATSPVLPRGMVRALRGDGVSHAHALDGPGIVERA